jgi:hypothetical protein
LKTKETVEKFQMVNKFGKKRALVKFFILVITVFQETCPSEDSMGFVFHLHKIKQKKT